MLDTRSITEPAGALALAGLKHYIAENKLVGAGKRFAVVVSGANMNFGRLRFVAERAELGEGREVLFSVEIPETPGRVTCRTRRYLTNGSTGSFVRLHNIIFPRAVTEFVYRYSRADKAHVFLSFILNTPSREKEVAQVIADLLKEGMEACDISEDELAKAHGRYMVGGCQSVEHERVFRFGQWNSSK